MIYMIFFVNFLALWVLLRKRIVPRPFPWGWALAFLAVLTFSGVSTGHIGRALGFVTLLSAVVISGAVPRPERFIKVARILSILLVLFMAAELFGLISPPPFQSEETYFNGMLHRPVGYESPNVKAAWLLLMPLSGWTVAGVVIAISRGALLGLLAVLAARLPRCWWLPAGLGGLAVCAVALWVRPGTAFVRGDLWLMAWRMFIEHPLLGIGTGMYFEISGSSWAQTAHNAALTILAENGMVGLIPLLGWVVSLVLIARHSSSPARWSLLAFSVQQLVDDQWLGPVTALLVGINIALMIRSNQTPPA